MPSLILNSYQLQKTVCEIVHVGRNAVNTFFFFHSKFLDRICGLRGMALDVVRKLRASIYFRDNLCGLDFNLRILELSIS